MVDLVNASSCGLFSFNDEGIILQVNTTICTLLEAEKEALLGQKVNSIFTVPTLIFFQTHLYPLLKLENSLEEIFITLKSAAGREVPVLLSAKRFTEADATENVCSCLTVYNRKQYEAEIIEARKVAERALKENSTLVDTQHQLQEHVLLLDEKMFLLQQYNETLKEISHAVSHELQEPVRKLHLFTDLLLHHKDRLLLEENQRKLQLQIQRIKEILYGLQQYVWLEDDQPGTEKIDLNKELDLAKKQLQEETSGFSFDITTSNLPVIQGKSHQFVILFYQLFSNALKFRSSERPLQIVVDATIINRNQFKLLQNHYSYRAYHKIDISDNGTGFDPKYGSYIFQLFKRLDLQAAGSGIGLTLCKKIVLNHNGLITASSKEGAGSVFTIFLPVEEEQPAKK